VGEVVRVSKPEEVVRVSKPVSVQGLEDSGAPFAMV
jgi:hypothetical protein